MIAAQSSCLAVPAALIGVPPLIAELSENSILQLPNTLTPKWDVPTLVFLWSLVVGIRMPLTKACRITPCSLTTLKANGFALWQTVSAPINMNQLESSGINHFKRNNLPGLSQLKPSKYLANSHKTRSKTRHNNRKNSRILLQKPFGKMQIYHPNLPNFNTDFSPKKFIITAHENFAHDHFFPGHSRCAS
jgi:hypothetical protein